MRTRILCLAVAIAAVAARNANADSPWDAELRLGYGVTEGKTATGVMATRTSPLSITAIAGWAVSDDPPLMGYGGLTLETLDRTSVGAVAGVKLAVAGPIRVTAGGAFVFAPYTLWGATGSVGGCHRLKKTLSACADLQVTAYFAGDDLVDHHAITQVQLLIGMVVDAP